MKSFLYLFAVLLAAMAVVVDVSCVVVEAGGGLVASALASVLASALELALALALALALGVVVVALVTVISQFRPSVSISSPDKETGLVLQLFFNF